MSSFRLSKQLRDGEKVLWSGRPQRIPFALSTLRIFNIPVGIIFIVVSISMLTTQTQAPFPFILIVWLFPFIGFGLIFGPLVLQLLRYGATEYMITDQRVIKQTGILRFNIEVAEYDEVEQVSIETSMTDRLFETGTVVAFLPGGKWVTRGGGEYDPGHSVFVKNAVRLHVQEPYKTQKLLLEALGNTTSEK